MSGFPTQRIHSYACHLFERVHKNVEVSIPLVLSFLLVAVVLANDDLLQYSKSHSVKESPLRALAQAPYPVVRGVLGPTLSARSFVVVDDDSKAMMFSLNEHLRLAMASTTKLMTALAALDYFHTYDVLSVFEDRVEGTTVGFRKGEQFTFESLLYALLLPSGNDAAKAIAQNFPGGERAFVRKMNEKAFAMRLFDTNFSNPAGLVDEGDYTTALDLARLSSFALKNDTIARIVGTGEKVIATIDGKKTHTLLNLNKLLVIDNVTGIKTGFTDGAGGVLVTSVVEGDHTIIIVVMKSKDRFDDTQKLLSLLRGKVTYVSTRW